MTDVIHGATIVDEYRWLEGDNTDPADRGKVTPEVGVWTDAQNQYTRQVLDNLPGRAALEAFRANSGKWRAAVLEGGLQDVSAESLSVEFSRIRPELPIILCSEVGKIVTLDRIRASGVTEIVATPVDPGELAIAVERALRTGARRL